MRGYFEGSGKLTRFYLRRERVMSPVWIISIVVFSMLLAVGMGTMFTPEARQALAITLSNPGVISMLGPVYGAGNYTEGAMYSSMMLLWIMLIVGVMNIFLVVRHTRADEEKGRAEVVRSLPTGRLATLNAAIHTAAIVNVVMALLTGFGIAAMRVESMDFGACMLYGTIVGTAGMFFAATAALFSQLCASSRGAIGLSLAALGALYMLRAAGDIGNEVLSFISPLGLLQRSKVFVENDPLPVVIVLAETLVVTVKAYLFGTWRDIDRGYISERAGHAAAPRSLRSSFGLSLRLLRGTLITWFIVMALLGTAYGSILGDIESFVNQSDFYRMMIGSSDKYSVSMMFTTTVNAIASLICVIPLLTAILKPRAEERDNRTELVLSRVVSRTRYLAGYVGLAFAASVVLQTATAFGLYASASAVLSETISLGFLIQANMAYLPALWVFIGLGVLLVGIAPKAVNFIWAFYVFTFFIIFVGRMLVLPDWLVALTPFSHIPIMPVDEVNITTLGVMTLVAAALTAVGFVFYNRRDTTGTA